MRVFALTSLQGGQTLKRVVTCELRELYTLQLLSLNMYQQAFADGGMPFTQHSPRQIDCVQPSGGTEWV